MDKIKEFVIKFMVGRYGVDDMSKMLFISSGVCYLVGTLTKSIFIMGLAFYLIVFNLYRILSKQYYDRMEENKKYLKYIKLWKLRYTERKDYKIFVCKSCGRFVRVPKNKGKIQVTCTVCGDKTIRRT